MSKSSCITITFALLGKIRLALGLKGRKLELSRYSGWTPRPKLTPMTGGYRRTPILQVGAEFYCDTLHILRAIEAIGLFGVALSESQEGLAKALGWWIEKGSFMNAVCLTIGNMPGLLKSLSRNDVRSSGQPGS